MAETIDISVKGRWVSVPALAVCGTTLIVTGSLLRLAAVHDETWLETEVDDPDLYVRSLRDSRSSKLRADIFTFSQKPPSTVPRVGYKWEWESVAVVSLRSFKAWWDKLPQETRKNVRRAQKRGVVVDVKELDQALVKGIAELNNDSPMRQGRPNRHYGKSHEQVKRDYSSFLDRSDLVCAFVGEELIGLLKIVYRGNGVASILQCLPKASHHDKRPANALVAKAMELCEAKGVAYVTYGHFRYGNKRDNPLLEFKVRNGFEEMLIPRYYIPLTAWGRVALMLGLHRGLLGLLPHQVIAAAVRARAEWYALRQWLRRCSSRSEQPIRNRPMESANPPAGSKT